MPVYRYVALNQKGKQQTGIIDAESDKNARRKLQESGLLPVRVARASESTEGVHSFFSRKIRQVELGAFTRHMATLLTAGIPMVQVIDSLQRQTRHPKLQMMLAEIKTDVIEGNALAEALGKHPEIFSPVYINMVKAGEMSGTLDVVMERLADFIERQQELSGRVKSALLYPAFMAVVGTAIVICLLTIVVPSITGIFLEMHKAMPMPTRILIGISSALQQHWQLICLACIVAFFGINSLRRYRRELWDSLLLSIPVLGPVLSMFVTARFSRTVGSLLQNGIPLPVALKVGQNIVNYRPVARKIAEIQEKINHGVTFSSAMRESGWFSDFVPQMIAAGEQSGELDTMCLKVAESFEKQAERRLSVFVTMVEPAMILIMGGVVGFVVMAILLPIFAIQQLVH